MKEEGIVRNVGFGMRPLDFHVRAIETGKVDLVLTFMDYTLLSQTAADVLFPVAQEHDTGIILASVQGMGLLAGPEPDDEQWERGAYPGQEPRAHAIWMWCREWDVNIRALIRKGNEIWMYDSPTRGTHGVWDPANRPPERRSPSSRTTT